MTPKQWLTVFTAGAAAIAVPARAEDLSVTVTHSSIAESRIDNQNGIAGDDNYGILINRINLNGNAGDLSAHVRVDTTTFYEALGSPYKDDLRLERFSAEYQLGAWQLVGGDFYRQLGRGILLSLRKEDEVGVDLTIRGGEIRYRDDEHEVGLFGGLVNPTNLDAVSQKHVRDTDDAMAGGEYHFRGLNGLTLGVQALFLHPRVNLLADQQDWSQSGGVIAELTEIGGWLSLYAEANGQFRRLAGSDQWGVAGTLATDVFFGDTSLLLEGLVSHAFEQLGSTHTALGARTVYNRPPTLQRIQEEVLNTRDVAGGRLKVEHYLDSLGLVLFVNGLLRFAGENQEVMQIHGWGGGEVSFLQGRSHLHLTIGYRHETQSGARLKSMLHFYGDWILPLGRGFALHCQSDTEYRTLGERDYWRGSTFLGLEQAGTGNLTFELGYDTFASDPEQRIRNYFFAGILGLEVTHGLMFNVVGGTQRGGLKCVSGICREYPAFAGGRVEVVGRW